MRSATPPAARTALAASALFAAGCVASGRQDVLDPAGPHARWTASFFWVSYGLAIAVFVGFMALLAWALLRARRSGEANDLPETVGRRLVLWGGLVVPTVILLFLLVLSNLTDRRISRFARADPALTIEVTGEQFWWQLRYRDAEDPAREFTTANELHIPAGRPVRLVLRSRDVIHSLWVPNLNGKTDLIPGRTNNLILQADEPGVYRGQCAEFCGTQHAKMALLVVAHPPDGFEAWREQQLRPQSPPADSAAARGQEVFMRTGCALCHSIRGTEAHGTVAPDLTHFATRRTIAAGTLPNTRGHLGGWIAGPQGIKPGSRMPAVPLEGAELRDLLTYLQSLR